jgi:hypothetical protein
MLAVAALMLGPQSTIVAAYGYDTFSATSAAAHGAHTATTPPASTRTNATGGRQGAAGAPWSSTSSPGRFLAAEAGTALVKYDADFALGQLTRSGSGKASELVDFAKSQGWTRSQTATGPIKFIDDNGVTRLTIKSGSPRAPGSNFPHVEVRNAAGQRVDPYMQRC